MTLSEATRQYQATLTAIRSSEDAGTDEDFMRDELEAARRQMEIAWLRQFRTGGVAPMWIWNGDERLPEPRRRFLGERKDQHD